MQTHTFGVAPERQLYFDRPLLQKRPIKRVIKRGSLHCNIAKVAFYFEGQRSCKRDLAMCVCVCVCARARARMCLCMCVCARARVYIQTDTHRSRCTYICIIHTDPDVHTYVYIYRICIYIYIQRPKLWLTTTHCHTLQHTAIDLPQ